MGAWLQLVGQDLQLTLFLGHDLVHLDIQTQLLLHCLQEMLLDEESFSLVEGIFLDELIVPSQSVPGLSEAFLLPPESSGNLIFLFRGGGFLVAPDLLAHANSAGIGLLDEVVEPMGIGVEYEGTLVEFAFVQN